MALKLKFSNQLSLLQDTNTCKQYLVGLIMPKTQGQSV